MKNIKENEYKIAEENGMVCLHITKELNDILLTNKALGSMMVEVIKQKHVKKVIID